jgi:hypothetical protein
MSYDFTADSHDTYVQPLPTPIIHPDEFSQLQLQARKVHLSTLVRSYISSFVIALRLHPQVVSTSISARVVGDVRNLVRVFHLWKVGKTEWANAEDVPKAVELCTSFRVRIEVGEENVTYQQILAELLENVHAPV